MQNKKAVLQEFVWVLTAQLLETSYSNKFLQKKMSCAVENIPSLRSEV